jgi:hypothetical protein
MASIKFAHGMRYLVLFLGILCTATAQGQLSNRLFREGPAVSDKKYAFSFEALQFLKNNEYFNGINPGETLFGFQTRAVFRYKIAKNATFSADALLQHDFGDPAFFTKAIPLFDFQLRKNKWLFHLGTIRPHIHHNMSEAMLSYENVMKQPAELGLQGLFAGKHLSHDVWLHWRQKADAARSSREEIIFGNSLEYFLLKTNTISLSIPFQSIIYHHGGQSLNLAGNVATRMLFSPGLRLAAADSQWVLESFIFQSLDNSQNRSQPYASGQASMTNLRWHPHRYHEVALTWWWSREFVSPIGGTVFSNVNLSNPYNTSNTRRLAMLRYVYSRSIIPGKIWMDLRLEPYYDMERKGVEMSQGLYFRYVEELGFSKPKWMGLF